MQYNPALDGLRAYAVGFVVLAHLPAIQGVDFTFAVKTIASGMRLGYLGVDIFFVLSGFLITRILLEDKRQHRYSLARFYAKRTLRIFPIFYLSLLLCALIFALPKMELIANAFYVSNYYYAFHDEVSPLRHTWSLSVEEQFYLVWPLALYFIPIKRVGAVLVSVVPVIVLASLAISYVSVDESVFGQFVTRGVMFRMLSLGAGGLLAFHVLRLRAVPLRLIVIAAGAGLAGHILSLFLDTYARSIIGLFSMSLLATSIFLLAYVGHERGWMISRILLESRPIVYLGKISYGIYLYHFMILYALDARGSGNPDGVSLATWMTFVFLAVVVPALSYRYIESPLLEVKNRLNRVPATRGKSGA